MENTYNQNDAQHAYSQQENELNLDNQEISEEANNPQSQNYTTQFYASAERDEEDEEEDDEEENDDDSNADWGNVDPLSHPGNPPSDMDPSAPGSAV